MKWSVVKELSEVILHLIAVIFIIAIILGSCLSWNYFVEFPIYQKKYGTQMTFIDFWFDAERSK